DYYCCSYIPISTFLF
nr:immunoglobulin light chain junction region [Macaca mulatta]MOW18319.1 immunoglobulin light chain junction region [Macaca mulatta]